MKTTETQKAYRELYGVSMRAINYLEALKETFENAEMNTSVESIEELIQELYEKLEGLQRSIDTLEK
jgi:hypothetical protein